MKNLFKLKQLCIGAAAFTLAFAAAAADKGTAAEAVAMVQKGVALMQSVGPEKAFAEFNDPQGALIEYAQVGPGNDYLPAQLRQADILISHGRGTEASAKLAAARDEQPDYAIQLFLIEAETLSANNQTNRAWDVLQQALKQYPDDLNLLYSRAMLAESS